MSGIIDLLKLLKSILFKSEHERLLQDWFRIDGDKNFRLGHNLNENSIVFDVGGYKGKFINDIYSKFKCNVYSFEPVEEFYNEMDIDLVSNSKIRVFNFGLSNETKEDTISLDGDESSVYGNDKKVIVKFVDIVEFLDKEKIDKIDLMEINIEGAEYDLLDHMIKNGIHKKINNIQIQFHKNVKDYKKLRENIQKELSKTHDLIYNFDFIMENWRLKNDK